jgi:hypothetical protein
VQNEKYFNAKEGGMYMHWALESGIENFVSMKYSDKQ